MVPGAPPRQAGAVPKHGDLTLLKVHPRYATPLRSSLFVGVSLQLGAPNRVQDPELASSVSHLGRVPFPGPAHATQDGVDLPHCKHAELVDSRYICPAPAPQLLLNQSF